MQIEKQGHIKRETLEQNAVSLTPDILKILEETREGAMEELDKVGDYNEEKGIIYKRHYVGSEDPVVAYLDALEYVDLKDNDYALEKLRKIIVKPYTVIIGEYEIKRTNEKLQDDDIISGTTVMPLGQTLWNYSAAESVAKMNTSGWRILTNKDFKEIMDTVTLLKKGEIYNNDNNPAKVLEKVLMLSMAGFFTEKGSAENFGYSNTEMLWLKSEKHNGPAFNFVDAGDWGNAILIDMENQEVTFPQVSKQYKMSVRLGRKGNEAPEETIPETKKTQQWHFSI